MNRGNSRLRLDHDRSKTFNVSRKLGRPRPLFSVDAALKKLFMEDGAIVKL